MTDLKPMLAAAVTNEQLAEILETKHLIASPKLDGIRCTIQDGVALSRSLKKIRNPYVQEKLGHQKFNGLDGELIVGDPTAHDVYRVTNGGVMRGHGEPEFTFYAFDNLLYQENYQKRLSSIVGDGDVIERHQCDVVLTVEDLIEVEEKYLQQGYEGVILRDPDGAYKNGRSTVKQAGMMKMKQFIDAEATVIGMEELMHNANESFTNELGRTARSSHQEGKVPMDSMGALVCKDVKTGVEFNIGTGFSANDRKVIWTKRAEHMGQLVKYKSFPIGVKDAPRHPVFLGFRDQDDL
jgi:DNA ligase 1